MHSIVQEFETKGGKKDFMAFELKTIFHLNALWYNFYLRRNIHSHFPVFRQPDSRFVNFSLSAYFFISFHRHLYNCYRFHSVADDFSIASTLWLDDWLAVGWPVCDFLGCSRFSIQYVVLLMTFLFVVIIFVCLFFIFILSLVNFFSSSIKQWKMRLNRDTRPKQVKLLKLTLNINIYTT